MPYFYFRSSWHTDLESVKCLAPYGATKFDADSTIRSLIAFLLLTRYVTLWPWSVVIHGGSHDQPLQCPPSLKIVRLSVLELSSDISHRIPLIIRLQPLSMRHMHVTHAYGQIFPYIWSPWTRFYLFIIQLYDCTIKTNWIICQNNVSLWPCVCTVAKSHEPWRKSVWQHRLLLHIGHSILWPRFPYRERHFGDLKSFSVNSVDFCTG